MLCDHVPNRGTERRSASADVTLLRKQGTIPYASCWPFSNQGETTMAMQARETEARETSSLIGSDKVEGTTVYGANDQKIGSIERVMIDKIRRQSVLRRPELWGVPRHRRRALSAALAIPEIRYQSRRLSYRYHREPAQRRAEIHQ